MKTTNTPSNEATKIPAAACPRCGGWTTTGGMSQYANNTTPVLGRVGCDCNHRAPLKTTIMTIHPCNRCNHGDMICESPTDHTNCSLLCGDCMDSKRHSDIRAAAALELDHCLRCCEVELVSIEDKETGICADCWTAEDEEDGEVMA